jgi:ferredoxin
MLGRSRCPVAIFDKVEVMPKVHFERENKEVEVEDGESLRYIAMDHNIPIYCGVYTLANCHGNGLCGSDKVSIEPANAVNPRTAAERFHLRKKPELRLACQVEVHGDITVTTQCGRRR